MLATFAMADEAPQTPGISIHEMFKLRQMLDDLQNNPKKDFSLSIRPNEICLKNNENNDEVCIHKAILAEMILEAYKSGQQQILNQLEKILFRFKQADLPEFTVKLEVNTPNVYFDENDRQVIDLNNKPFIRFKAATPTESFVAESETQVTSPSEVTVHEYLHVDKTIDIVFESKIDPRNGGKLDDYWVRVRNLKPRRN